MQKPHEQQYTGGDGEGKSAPAESHSQETGVHDSEDAVILTARRVKMVRCRAKQTTISSVRFPLMMFRRMQLLTATKCGIWEGQKAESTTETACGSPQKSVEMIAGHLYSLA